MKFVSQDFEVLHFQPCMAEMVERIARDCYDSTGHGGTDAFIRGLIRRGHSSPFYHVHATVRFSCSERVATHLKTHAHSAFIQRSTRGCTLDGLECIVPHPRLTMSSSLQGYIDALELCEKTYMDIKSNDLGNDIASDVLPRSMLTHVTLTTNAWQWRHIFRLRGAPPAHWQVVELIQGVQKDFAERCPSIFDTI